MYYAILYFIILYYVLLYYIRVPFRIARFVAIGVPVGAALDGIVGDFVVIKLPQDGYMVNNRCSL